MRVTDKYDSVWFDKLGVNAYGAITSYEAKGENGKVLRVETDYYDGLGYVESIHSFIKGEGNSTRHSFEFQFD